MKTNKYVSELKNKTVAELNNELVGQDVLHKVNAFACIQKRIT